MAPKTWKLTRGGILLTTLVIDGEQQFVDYPGCEGTYQIEPAFEELRPLFQRELQLLDIDEPAENDEWADIWERLAAPGLFVESADGKSRIEILWIHFKDGRAWWFPLYNSPNTTQST